MYLKPTKTFTWSGPNTKFNYAIIHLTNNEVPEHYVVIRWKNKFPVVIGNEITLDNAVETIKKSEDWFERHLKLVKEGKSEKYFI